MCLSCCRSVLSDGLNYELGLHGVGVTCLAPGHTTGTEFADRGHSSQALITYLPGTTAAQVGEMGVAAMLSDTGVRLLVPGAIAKFFFLAGTRARARVFSGCVRLGDSQSVPQIRAAARAHARLRVRAAAREQRSCRVLLAGLYCPHSLGALAAAIFWNPPKDILKNA